MIYNNSDLKLFFREFLKAEFEKVSVKPELHIIQIGNELASTKYIGLKQKFGESLGVKVLSHQFPVGVDLQEIAKIIKQIEINKFGLIFQLPVPDKFQKLVLETPLKSDVDLLGSQNNLLLSQNFLTPTIGAIDLVLKEMLGQTILNIDDRLDLSTKIVAVVGQGRLVGSPLLSYLKDRNATIISINKDTKNPEKLVSQAEIVITAAGSPGLVDDNWLAPNAILIDAATTEDNGSLIGDLNYDNISPLHYVATSPGGIGPITVSYIFYNLLKLAKLNYV